MVASWAGLFCTLYCESLFSLLFSSKGQTQKSIPGGSCRVCPEMALKTMVRLPGVTGLWREAQALRPYAEGPTGRAPNPRAADML